MTKVQSSEKSSSGGQKKGSKRKIDDKKELTKKPGRPRLNSNATESMKGKRRNSAVSEKKTSSTFEHQNGKTACDDLADKYKGILISLAFHQKSKQMFTLICKTIEKQTKHESFF